MITADPAAEFYNNVFGSVISLGFEIPLIYNFVAIPDTRYEFGLTKSAKNTYYNYDSNSWDKSTPYNFKDMYNRTFSINFGLIYKFGKNK